MRKENKHLPRLEMLRLVSSPWLTVVSAMIIIFVIIYVLDADRSGYCVGTDAAILAYYLRILKYEVHPFN